MPETKQLNFTPENTALAGQILREGGLVAIPTETVYGLAANAFNGEACARIFAAKGRPSDNPLIVHIASLDQWPALVAEVPEAAVRLAEAFWPGPLSIILPKSDKIPDQVSGGLDTVAVRMPSHPAAAAVIRAAGVPLAAPSANLSGSPSPTTAQHVLRDLQGRIDAVLDGGACEVGVESTVISLAGKTPRVLRPGGISVEQLRAVLGEVEVDEAVLHQLAPGQQAVSPGMKYKHYSPKTRVIIVKGSFAAFQKFVSNKKDCAALCFACEGEQLDIPFIEVGREHDSLSQAHRLFDALRRVDELGVSVAYARCPDTDGVGLAVLNRLLRAAAFTVVDLNGAAVIGLTGPTGAGKSTVADILQKKHAFAWIDADQTARGVTEKGSSLLPVLAEHFGADILDETGALIRSKLAARAFASPEKTALLNQLTHPAVTERIFAQVARLSAAGTKAVLIDAAALYESKIDKLCAFTAVVTASEPVRLRRIMARDGLDEPAARLRMKAQLSAEDYEKNADVIVRNEPPFDVETEAEKIFERYKELTENE